MKGDIKLGGMGPEAGDVHIGQRVGAMFQNMSMVCRRLAAMESSIDVQVASANPDVLARIRHEVSHEVD